MFGSTLDTHSFSYMIMWELCWGLLFHGVTVYRFDEKYGAQPSCVSGVYTQDGYRISSLHRQEESASNLYPTSGYRLEADSTGSPSERTRTRRFLYAHARRPVHPFWVLLRWQHVGNGFGKFPVSDFSDQVTGWSGLHRGGPAPWVGSGEVRQYN
jgi:hypothetical protein